MIPPALLRRPPRAYTPDNFDAAALAAAVGHPDWADYFRWVVGRVYIHHHVHHHSREEFVPLYSGYLSKFINNRTYPKVLKALMDNKVLERLDYFRPTTKGKAGQSYTYRLHEPYRSAKHQSHPLTHSELLARITRRREERTQELGDVHRWLMGWMAKVETLEAAPEGEHVLLDPLIHGDRRFKVCKQGRVHTWITSLPHQYRQFIRLDGQHLVQIDVSHAQPLLLGIKVREYLLQNQSNPSQPWSTTSADSSSLLVVYSSLPDLNEYMEDCVGGALYGQLQDDLGGEEEGWERQETKDKFLAVVYGDPHHMFTRMGMAFRRRYPVVHRAIWELAEIEGHGGLPVLMQTLEADIMIRRVCGRLMRERPNDLPVLTLHDAILVPPEEEGYVTEVMRQEWAAATGLEPRLKSSPFTVPQPARNRKKKKKGRQLAKARRGQVEVHHPVRPDPDRPPEGLAV